MKGLFELDYVDVDGVFYPKIEIDGAEILSELGKYGGMRLEYLHEHRAELYRELLLCGELERHCKSVDELGFEMAEPIQEAYIKNQQVSDLDFMERIQLYTMAQNVADEVVFSELVYK